MGFDPDDVRALLSQLEAEADGRPVDRDWVRVEVERLMALYPGMANVLAPVAERYARQAA